MEEFNTDGTPVNPEMNYFPEGTFSGSFSDPVETRLRNIERLLHGHRHSTADRTQPLRVIPPVVKSITTGGTSYIIPVEECDMLVITAQATAIDFANPTQSSYNGQKILIRIQDDGTARAITWGSQFRAGTSALPTTTVSGKYKYIGFMRNTDDTKWDLLGVSDEA
jgi:hypothetical protein